MVSCCCSVIKSCPTHCDPVNCDPRLPCPPLNSRSLLKLMFIEPVMLFTHLIFCHPLSFWLRSFPASGFFPMSRLFITGGQNTGAPAIVLPMNIQGWFPLGLTGLISLLSKGLSEVFSGTAFQSQFFLCSALFMVHLSHPYVTLKKLYGPWSAKWFLWFLIWCLGLSQLSLQGASIFRFHGCSLPSAVILETKKIKFVTASTFP